MKQFKLKVTTKTSSYHILIGSNLLSKLSKILNDNSIKFQKCLLIIDKNIPKKAINKITKSLKHYEVYKHYFFANEKNKNLKNINKTLNILFDKNFSREDCLISVGGGITGDVAGFAASLYKRGLQFVNIPSTLLSQVDSSVGGKTGVNTMHGKNSIGSFYQPRIVISDTEFLTSLPKREIICGYGEILKHSLILNKNFYNYLSKNISRILKLRSPFLEKSILESCKIKKLIVEKDEKEKGIRKILNFGHTFAHAYEATLGYKKRLNHGEAVILGMQTALKFSLKKKIIREREYNSIIDHIDKVKFKSNVSNYFSSKHLNTILSFIIKDKKNNSDKINLILLKKIGYATINNYFSRKEIKTFLKKNLTN